MRKELFNSDNQFYKTMTSALESKHFTMGTSYANGDSFFDSVAQGLEQVNIKIPGSKKYPACKKLRMICDQYFKITEPKYLYRLNEALDEQTEIKDPRELLLKLPYTQEEMDQFKKEGALFSDGIATQGRLAVEGKILCEKLNITIHLLILKTNNDGNSFTLGNFIADKEGVRLFHADRIDYKDPKIIHISVYNNYYFPLLKNKSPGHRLEPLPVKAPVVSQDEQEQKELSPDASLSTDTPKVPVYVPRSFELLDILERDISNEYGKKIATLQQQQPLVSEIVEATVKSYTTEKTLEFNRLALEAQKRFIQNFSFTEHLDLEQWACEQYKHDLDLAVKELTSSLASHHEANTHDKYLAMGGQDRLVQNSSIEKQLASFLRFKVTKQDDFNSLLEQCEKASQTVREELAKIRSERERAYRRFDMIDATLKNLFELQQICQQGKLTEEAIEHIRRYLNSKVSDSVDINQWIHSGFNLLHLACLLGDPVLIQSFLKKGARIDQRTKDGYLPLHFAVKYVNSKLDDVLLPLAQLPKGLNEPAQDGKTALHTAALAGNLVTVQWLVTHEINLNVQESGGLKCTALHYAAFKGHYLILDFLLKAGANYNLRNARNERPIMEALNRFKPQMMQSFIEQGVWFTTEEIAALKVKPDWKIKVNYLSCIKLYTDKLQSEDTELSEQLNAAIQTPVSSVTPTANKRPFSSFSFSQMHQQLGSAILNSEITDPSKTSTKLTTNL